MCATDVKVVSVRETGQRLFGQTGAIYARAIDTHPEKIPLSDEKKYIILKMTRRPVAKLSFHYQQGGSKLNSHQQCRRLEKETVLDSGLPAKNLEVVPERRESDVEE
jgi:hypothetical protein